MYINRNNKFLRANEQIRVTPLTIIEENGDNIGIISREEALKLAQEKSLDLVEINPTTRPPICKIMDFGKYKYDNAKKFKESKAKQKEVELKEIRLTAKIGDHDIEYKAKRAREFLDDGDKVKVSMRLKGRENAFVENAMQVFNKFAIMANISYENNPYKSGNQITAMAVIKKDNLK